MIRVEHVTKAFGKKVLFSDLTYHFPQGERIALVGANGAGKSTLLKILCQLEDPDSGSVIRPAKMKLGYLPQEPNPLPKPTVLQECLDGAYALRELKIQLDDALLQMETNYSEALHARYDVVESAFSKAGGYALESRAKGILLGLGFHAEQLHEHPKNLSGGWRMRLELARLFLNDPDFLILDEPTNHLDLPSLVWVENYLQNFPGTLLFVSHDKSLLNRLSTYTLHLHKGRFASYVGNFDSFLEQREQRLALETAAAGQLKKKMADVERFVERFRAKASKARQAQSRMKTLVRLKELEGAFDTDASVEEIAFSLPKGVKSGKDVLAVRGLSTGYGTKVLARNIQFHVTRGQKIAIIGSNGIGKSTLLKTLASRIPPLAGDFELGHQVSLALFAQDQLDVLDETRTVLENVLACSPLTTERKARSLLGSFLFRGDDVFKPVAVLSGGEKSRVGLTCLLLQESNFLLLDEPTNHLDLSSIDILANALEDYEGTLLFVSHDRDFINSVCTHVLAMTDDGRFGLFEGQLEDYERLAVLGGFPDILSPGKNPIPVEKETAVLKASSDSTKNRASFRKTDMFNVSKKERQQLLRKKEQIENDLESLRTRLFVVESDMEKEINFSNPVKMQELCCLQIDIKGKISVVEEEWLDVEERLARS